MCVNYPTVGVPSEGCVNCGKPTKIHRATELGVGLEFCGEQCVDYYRTGSELGASWVRGAIHEGIDRRVKRLNGPTTIDNFWEKSEAGLDVSDSPLFSAPPRSQSDLLSQACKELAAEVEERQRQLNDCVTSEVVEELLIRIASVTDASVSQQIALHADLAECNAHLKRAAEEKRVADFLTRVDDV